MRYPVKDGFESMCLIRRDKYNTKTWDTICVFVLYIIPVVLLILLYTRIAITLNKSGKFLKETSCSEMSTFPPGTNPEYRQNVPLHQYNIKFSSLTSSSSERDEDGKKENGQKRLSSSQRSAKSITKPLISGTDTKFYIRKQYHSFSLKNTVFQFL